MESNRLTLLYNVSTGTIEAEDGVNNLYLHSVLTNELVVRPSAVLQTSQLVYCTFQHLTNSVVDLTLKPILLAKREATSVNSTTTVVDDDEETTTNEVTTEYEYYTQIPQAVLINVGSWRLSFFVKEYSSIPATATYCGEWDASSSVSQTIRTPQTGDYYVCLTQGSYNPQGTATTGVATWKVGDFAKWSGSAWAKDTSRQVATSGLFNFSVANSLPAGETTPTDADIYNVWVSAEGYAQDSEAYAIGKRGGVDVGSTDVAYHNNSKYYSEQASASATSASNSATSASASAESAEDSADSAEASAESALSAQNTAQTARNQAVTAASQASASATSAGTSATSASTDATRAETAADRAEAAMSTKLDKKPDGTTNLIDSNNKIDTTYIPESLVGGLTYKGTFNATTGASITPQKNWYYICATAGSKNPDATSSGISYEAGDWAIYSGTEWQKVDNTDAVKTVNGQIGNVETYKGTYTSGNTYYKGDILLYSGVLYLCVQLAVSQAITDTTYFMPLVTLDAIVAKMEGSDYIVVEENDAGTKVVVELDQTNLETSGATAGSSKLITSGAVASSIASASSVFIATYGTTTKTEIDTAIASGKLPVCVYDNKVYVGGVVSGSTYYFYTFITNSYVGSIWVQGSTWSNGTAYLQYRLPTTTTAGKVLKSTSTAGTTEWGDAEAGTFVVTYGTTTFAEIGTAISSGKIPVLYKDRQQYYFSATLIDSEQAVTGYQFTQDSGYKHYNYIINASSVWSAGSVEAQPKLSSAQQNAVNSGIDSTKVAQIATNTSDIADILDGTQSVGSADVATGYSNGGSIDTALQARELQSNKVTSLSASSTDTQYPSAKCVYDAIASAITTTLSTPV